MAPSCRGDRGANILTGSHDLGDFLVRARISEAPCSPSARLLSQWKVTFSLPQAPIILPEVTWSILRASTELWSGKMWAKVLFLLNFSPWQERLKERWTKHAGLAHNYSVMPQAELGLL